LNVKHNSRKISLIQRGISEGLTVARGGAGDGGGLLSNTIKLLIILNGPNIGML